ncbi:MAG: MoaD/ThiS family protein [Candidatus Poribacteria bacterium]|nr:MoaD/ThiS family protein [Candidatus Poribacteria bacterium]
MKITIEYSAQIRRALGVSEETIDLENSQNLHDLVLYLAEKHGQLFKDLILDMEGNLSRMILASVNGVQVQGRTSSADLKDGDLVNLMSPISGG